jgi:hypothetical protein
MKKALKTWRTRENKSQGHALACGVMESQMVGALAELAGRIGT